MIGVFDSGVGGLTVVKQIFKYLPQYRVLYFGDTARVPYGSKSSRVIRQYALEDADFLLKQGAAVVLIACNTVSSVAYETLNGEYPVPVLDIVRPGVKAALAATGNGRIGVIGTLATVRSGTHRDFLSRFEPAVKVFYQACPVLVSIAEHNSLRPEIVKMIVADYLRPLLAKRIDTLILACTHFPLFAETIREVVGGNVALVDPAERMVLDMVELLRRDQTLEKTLVRGDGHRFFVSDIPRQFDATCRKFLGCKIGRVKIARVGAFGREAGK